ncbi:peptidase [Roseiconus nitratireducens]|uniref:Peptidase n=1 Tax=Roseiconus nitratireducens TaxID=2605748 RepID=A0A5M6D138_9BACT|nr:NfeD family protein [Roseiconus nitratireducens]KAA5541013.1 peptidase [Roseiconus nitratireducens]
MSGPLSAPQRYSLTARWAVLLLAIFGFLAPSLPAQPPPEEPAAGIESDPPTDPVPPRPAAAKRTAVMIPLHEDINPLSGELLKRKFADAVDSDADVIILDIHSPGGLVYVTLELMDMILDARDVETVAFIQKDAISGAALIALACDKIVMLPGARMGDAGEIVMGADGAFRYTEAKSRSVLAQKVRDTARATGRPIALAEKMTDKDMVVFRAVHKSDGAVRYISDKEWASMDNTDDWERGKPIREAGKEMFFTVNGARAVELGMADQTVQNESDLADALNVKEPIRVMHRTGVDTAIVILNSGIVTFLLLVIGLVALVIELSAPGMGIGGLTSILCFGLFFWSRFLGGTSGWLEVTLFILGVLFMALEVFVIPGTGVAGVGGLVLMLGSLVMASRRFMIPGNAEEMASLGWDILTVLGAFTAFLVALLILANYIGDIPGLSRLTLKPQLATAGDAHSAMADSMSPEAEAMLPGWQRVSVGDQGTTSGPLRPSGKMTVDDYLVDVVTEGDFVPGGTQVKVIAKQGARVIVRAV